MARFEEHRVALKLRKEGKSYSQIKAKLGIGKSTLSGWLNRYPLSKERIRELRDRSEVRIEKFRQTMRKKIEARLEHYYKEEKVKWLPLSRREVFLSGLFLYWGEGNKSQRGTIALSNTNPLIVKFALAWMVGSLNLPLDKIRVSLHLYSDMNVNEEIGFWSQQLGISKNQFTKPYIKKTKKVELDRKGYGRGTCELRVSNTVIKERMMMALRAIAEDYEKKSTRINWRDGSSAVRAASL